MRLFELIGRGIGRRAAEDAVKSYFASDKFTSAIDKIIREELSKPEYAWFRFVKRIQAELCASDPSLPSREAFYKARDAYREFLRDERIKFGDPRYAWDASGARDIARKYEIDHWEKRP